MVCPAACAARARKSPRPSTTLLRRMGVQGWGCCLSFALEDYSAGEFGDHFVETGTDEIARQWQRLFNAAPQVFQARHQGRNRVGFVRNTTLHDPPRAQRSFDGD